LKSGHADGENGGQSEPARKKCHDVTPKAVECGAPVTGVATSIGGTTGTLNGRHLNGAVTVSAPQTRRNRLITLIGPTNDAFLVTNLVNVRYLTGFTGSNAAVLVSRDRPTLIATDGRYLTQVAAQSPDLECIEARAAATALVDRAAADGVRRLAIEAGDVTLELRDLMLTAAAGRLELVASGPLVEQLRAVKDDDELASLAQACAITDAAFSAVMAQLRPGVSEREVAWWLQSAIRDHGGDGLAFDSIVAFGANSAIPHHEATDVPLAVGDLVKLDFGARRDGYHADMTRTVVMGPATDWQRELHGLVSDVQQRCRDAAVVGALPRGLDALARESIEAAGHLVAHGLGHGVGLEIHELPLLSATSTADRLADRVPVTIEPGVYLPDHGGVRIEDTVVVGVDGARSLTTSPRELIEVT
jgi:Xaa-Pro aminopeptidase